MSSYQRVFDTDEQKDFNYNFKFPDRFRRIFVLKPALQYDFSALRQVCDHFIYATDGYAETVGVMIEQLNWSLSEFDPHRDLIVTVGSNNICFHAGVILGRRFEQQGVDAYFLGAYTGEGNYEFWRVPLDRNEQPFVFGRVYAEKEEDTKSIEDF